MATTIDSFFFDITKMDYRRGENNDRVDRW